MRGLAAVAALLAVTACGEPSRRPPAAPTRTESPAATRSLAPRDLPASMAALGDSMTRAFLACEGLADCPVASWSTGGLDAVDSHARRIERLAGRPVTTHNLAVSGARVSGLATQVTLAIRARPAYVTVLIGANDACTSSEETMTPVTEFGATFDRELARLVRRLPRTRVLVASIPDLLRLWEVGHDVPTVREAWERYGICRSMLGDATDTGPAAQARRARVRQRVAGYNAAMAAACARHRTCPLGRRRGVRLPVRAARG